MQTNVRAKKNVNEKESQGNTECKRVKRNISKRVSSKKRSLLIDFALIEYKNRSGNWEQKNTQCKGKRKDSLPLQSNASNESERRKQSGEGETISIASFTLHFYTPQLKYIYAYIFLNNFLQLLLLLLQLLFQHLLLPLLLFFLHVSCKKKPNVGAYS